MDDLNGLLDTKLTAFAQQLGVELDRKLDQRFGDFEQRIDGKLVRMGGRLAHQISQGHEEIKQVVASTIEGYMREGALRP